MLRDEVIEAVAKGQFHIYPVATIEQGIEILTGVRAGKRDASGKFEPEACLRRWMRGFSEMAATLREIRMSPRARKSRPSIQQAAHLDRDLLASVRCARSAACICGRSARNRSRISASVRSAAASLSMPAMMSPFCSPRLGCRACPARTCTTSNVFSPGPSAMTEMPLLSSCSSFGKFAVRLEDDPADAGSRKSR